MQSFISHEFDQHIKACNETKKHIGENLELAANLCISCLKDGSKILLFGNGGSAADAQHIAAEIVGRYKTNRKGLPAIALTTDSSVLTSIGNDFGYSNIFNRQVEALANKKDVIIGISTGGNSLNVINALKTAKEIGCKTIGFSGKGGGDFSTLCDVNLIVSSNETPRIQEMHILFGHTICQLIDSAFID